MPRIVRNLFEIFSHEAGVLGKIAMDCTRR